MNTHLVFGSQPRAPALRHPAAAKDLFLRGLARSEQHHLAGETIQEEGAEAPRLRRVLSGWAASCRTLSDGRRQILRLLVPGDLCGIQALELGSGAGAVIALTRSVTADLGPSGALHEPELRDALRAAAAREHAELLTHLVRLGRMSAYERTGHLLLELFERLHAAGLTHARSMTMPLTQEVLADVLGLSIVHMNRTLQQLRREGLIVYRSGRMTFLDMEGLAQTCGYPLSSPPAAAVRPAMAAATRTASAGLRAAN